MASVKIHDSAEARPIIDMAKPDYMMRRLKTKVHQMGCVLAEAMKCGFPHNQGISLPGLLQTLYILDVYYSALLPAREEVSVLTDSG